ncbi:C6 zinc finger domain protein [Colletotrichum scovillei]|nr:C6 zinc finger domain protein [Colletotrichum scovillei]
MPPVKSACTACRASRVRCNGGKPCNRCIKRGDTCTFTASRRGLKLRGKATTSTSELSEQNLISTTSYTQGTCLGNGSTSTIGQETFAGLLPPLFNGDFAAFEFDNIFQGDSDADLDSFFVDIFSTPSFPRVGLCQPSSVSSTPSHHLDTSEYQSTTVVLEAYYRFLHPVFPLLPPPVDIEQLPSPPSSSSPLILALQALLTHVHQNGAGCDLNNERLGDRSFVSSSLAQHALETIETTASDVVTIQPTRASSFHPNVPVEAEATLACCALSLYQYLHHGNFQKMEALANKGLSLSKRMLESHDASGSGQFAESIRRAWWMSPFDEAIDSSSFKIPYPSHRGETEIWIQYIRAEEALVAATLMLAALLKGFSSETTASSFNRNIGTLDAVITHQLEQFNLCQIHPPDELGMVDNPESKLVICLRITTRVRLMSARIKLHRYRAFMDHPQILKKFESLPPSDSSIPLAQVINGNSGISDKAALVFPFSSNHSHNVCLESATAIAAGLKALASLGTYTTPAACSANLASFTLMVISHFQASADARGSSSSTRLDVQYQCKKQLNVAISALDKFSNAFGFVKALKGQLVTAAVACDLYDATSSTED